MNALCFHRLGKKLHNYERVSREHFDLESHLIRLCICPAINRRSMRAKPLLWFHCAIHLDWIQAARFFVISFCDPDSFWCFYLGDFTLVLGNSRDYCSLMIAIWSLAASCYMINIQRLLNSDQFMWISIFLPERYENEEKEYLSNLNREDNEIHRSRRKKLNELVVKVCKNGFQNSVISCMCWPLLNLGGMFLYRPLSYIMTMGLIWLPVGLMSAYSVTCVAVTFIGLFIVVCYDILLDVKSLRKLALNNITEELEGNRLKLNQVVLDYEKMRRKIVNQNNFWKQTAGLMFLGISAGICFNWYCQFLVDVALNVRIVLIFWGFLAAGVTVFLQTLVASYARSHFKNLHGPLYRLATIQSSIDWRLQMILTVEDVATLEPFTCLDMFAYSYSFVLRWFIEIIANLLLLVLMKSNSKS